MNIADRLKTDTLEEASYIAKHKCTVRDAAKHFGCSKSKVHLDCTYRLEKMAAESTKAAKLYKKVRKVLDINTKERHIRGGQSTARIFKEKKI